MKPIKQKDTTEIHKTQPMQSAMVAWQQKQVIISNLAVRG